MLPEVSEYFNAMNDTDGQHDNAMYRVNQENRVPNWDPAFTEEEMAAYFDAQEKRDVARREVDRDRKKRQAAAHKALVESDNPLIKWLMTNDQINRDYRGHRDQVLRALPLTREQIDEFGNEQGWCGDYGYLLQQAEAAGVLPEPTPDLADVAPLAQAIREWYGGSLSRAERIIKAQLPALLESAQKYAEEQASKNDGTSVTESAAA